MQLMSKEKKKTIKNSVRKYWGLYVLLIPVVAWFIIFCYYPMYGVIIGFKDYLPSKGILGSSWAANNGLEHFMWLFKTNQFTRA